MSAVSAEEAHRFKLDGYAPYFLSPVDAIDVLFARSNTHPRHPATHHSLTRTSPILVAEHYQA
ncbi:hypothetical protein K488DRAFT_89462 [Vararia minispora EC-137]|uniref:Uncharacterized protein n=1 Tax=Vararia minispora EC-137 TaxID=1314806 RepID=A0ACB8QAE8_9AGAM|nr:hypothetical protein K488DRAFT_89462 [Vararia minispora EC-137]